MPKATQLQESFNTGEVSPLFYGQISNPRYKKSLAKGLNWLPTLQGPLIRRPATKYSTPVKSYSNVPVLIPFNLSVTQAYVLEVGQNYIRFYANNGQIVNPGPSGGNWYQIVSSLGNFTRNSLTPYAGETIDSSVTKSSGAVLELVTQFLQADLSAIKFYQNKNTLYLVHPSYTTMKLIQYSTYEWGILPINFLDGPYQPLNTYTNLADGANITLTPGATSGITGLVTGPSTAITGAVSNGTPGLIRLRATGHGFSTGDAVLVASVTGTVEANNGHIWTATANWIVNVIDVNTLDLVGSHFVNAYISGGTVQPAIFPPYNDTAVRTDVDYGRRIALICSDGFRYTGRIVSQSSVYTASCEVLWDPGQTLPNTSPCSFWYVGTYKPRQISTLQGTLAGDYPSCGTFHQDRMVLAGPLGNPEEFDGSVTGSYENFAPSPANGTNALQVQANSAYQFNLLSRDVNVIRWCSSASQGLLMGTFESEWCVSPSDGSASLSALNVNALQTSYYGSANIDATRAGNATLYVQRGQRKLREMNYFFQIGTFRSTDLSELSEHLTIPTIAKLAVQKETQPIIWALRSDGQLLSMIYNRDDLSLEAGWTPHQLGGQSDSAGSAPIVSSMAVIPDPTVTFDQLWVIVQRYINGSTVYFIEYMTKSFDDSILQEDAFQGDCGSTYYAPFNITAMTTASPCVITVPGTGFSNGAYIKITGVVGLNQSTTDINGNVTETNLVNEKTFVVAGASTDTYQLNDFNGNPISSVGYSAYFSGGIVAKMVTSVTGLTYLENETVNVLADGGNHPPVVVSNTGVLALQYPAAKVQIGYAFNSDGQLMRPEIGSAEGTSIGQTRRVNRVAFMLHKIGNLLYGMAFNRLMPMQFTHGDVNQADVATPLFSGLQRIETESEYDFESQVCFRVNDMLPANVTAITIFAEENDV